MRKSYRQLRARVQRLRRQNRTAAVASGVFEVFGQQSNIYRRAKTARASIELADHLAARYPNDVIHVWAPDHQHVYEVHAGVQEGITHGDKYAERLAPPDPIPHALVAEVAKDLDWSSYAVLDLGFDLLEGVGLIEEADEILAQAQLLEPDYDYESADQDLVSFVTNQLRNDAALLAGFLVDLLDEVNWRSMARRVERYFFGVGETPNKNNRDASVAKNKRGNIMTQRPISRRRRQRLANRVERARSRSFRKDRETVRIRRASRTETKEARLKRRVASLTKLLKQAERELRRAAADNDSDLQARRARYAEIRERLAREERPTRRTAARRRRIQERLRRARAERRITEHRARRLPPRPATAKAESKEVNTKKTSTKRTAANTKEAPKKIRRKSDGKLYVRVD